MKTAEIKDLLKKDLLIVELPENGYYEEYRDGIEVRDFLTDEVLTLANYTILGSPDEIKEEDVLDLVEIVGKDDLLGVFYKNYKNPHYMMQPTSAIESLHSALETVIFWVNPYAEPDKFVGGFKNPCYEWWHEAESRTFDRNRTLIFVKN